MINPIIYRGYDIRAVMGKDLDEEGVYDIALGYAAFLLKRRVNEAVVGYDWRLTSPALAAVFMRGLTDSGVNVYSVGMVLTQMVYFAQYALQSVGGAVISASHNNKEYNGLKLAVGFSDTMTGDELQSLRILVEKKAFVEKSVSPGTVAEYDIFPAYKKDLLKRIHLKRKMKVVVDAGNGTAGAFMPEILRAAGCEVVEQYCEVDGNFPVGTPDPTETKMARRVADRVLKERAEVGLAYDGDGDRVGFVDEQGGIIWNDALVSLFARDVIGRNPGATVVFNTLCSRQVPEVIRRSGGKPVMWLTGHSFIKAKVRGERAPFGGELSGHFFFMDGYYGHDDGAYATLRLLDILQTSGQPLSALVARLPQYVSSPEIKLSCPDERKWELLKEIARAVKREFSEFEPNELEGVRMESDDAMLIVRGSQNGAYFTTKFEAKTPERYDEIKKRLYNVLKTFPELDFERGVNVESFRPSADVDAGL